MSSALNPSVCHMSSTHALCLLSSSEKSRGAALIAVRKNPILKHVSPVLSYWATNPNKMQESVTIPTIYVPSAAGNLLTPKAILTINYLDKFWCVVACRAHMRIQVRELPIRLPLLHCLHRAHIGTARQLWGKDDVVRRKRSEILPMRSDFTSRPSLHDSAFRPVFPRLAMDTHNGRIAKRDQWRCAQVPSQLHWN